VVFEAAAIVSADLTTFQQYYALADQLIDQSSKEALAECAWLLALNLAHYEMRYRALPSTKRWRPCLPPNPTTTRLRCSRAGWRISWAFSGTC